MRTRNIIKFLFSMILPLLVICGSARAENSISITQLDDGLFRWEKEHIPDKETYFIFSNASHWSGIEDFYKEVERKFKVPDRLKILNIQCYLDRIRNLYWFKPTKIVWFIKDLSKFTKCEDSLDGQPAGECIIETFKEYVLPFWEGIPGTGSVVDCWPGESTRQFNVYYT